MQPTGMLTLRKLWPLLTTFALTASFLISSRDAAFAQIPFPGWFAPGPPVVRALEGELPGVANRVSPFLFPPVFKAEVRVRPILIGIDGEVENRDTGALLDVRSDLGYEDWGAVVEGMVRAQLSRLSLRVHKEIYLKTFEGTISRFDWPEVRLGMDLDLVDSYRFRLGLNMDYYLNKPRFSLGSSPMGSFVADWPQPLTAGAHIRFNTPDLGVISGSFEGRYSTSLLTEVRMHEVDAALGLATPQTVLGTVGLRAGWRYTIMEYSIPKWQTDLKWSGIFLELAHNF
jgi:hypothetical protein